MKNNQKKKTYYYTNSKIIQKFVERNKMEWKGLDDCL